MGKIDYDTVYKEALDSNIKAVREEVLDGNKEMIIKMQNYAEKFNIPYKFLVHRILQDNLFANNFAKDPAKQSIHQKTAAAYIESIIDVVNFIQLPAGGKRARYVGEDGMMYIGEKKNKGLTKSIDFYWEYDGKQYYAAHKYTKDEGGAQDNQANDLSSFLKNASKSKLENTIFLAIGDGAYYQKISESEDDGIMRSRIEEMNHLYGSSSALAITTDDLEEFLVSNSSNKIIG